MKFYFANVDSVGLNIPHLSINVRTQENKEGGKVVVIDFTSIDPTGNGHLYMSESEAKDLRNNLDKLFPRLTGIKGAKS